MDSAVTIYRVISAEHGLVWVGLDKDEAQEVAITAAVHGGLAWLNDDLVHNNNSRSVTDRIAELEVEWQVSTGEDPSDFQLSEDDWSVGLGDDGAAELMRLHALRDNGVALYDSITFTHQGATVTVSERDPNSGPGTFVGITTGDIDDEIAVMLNDNTLFSGNPER